jgi:glycosyltransferase involved in cell wall biosynthesis
MTRRRVAVVMPPATDLNGSAALELWPTFTKALEALMTAGHIDPAGYCRTTGEPEVIERNGVRYHFEPSDRRLAERIAERKPAVVHVHGLGFTRLLTAIRRSVDRDVPILLQHHGERPPRAIRSRLAQRLTRRMVDGYLFTGAADQAAPFRRAEVINASAPIYEVLESASHLDEATPVDRPELGGSPCVLWVGRLIASKDPLCAVRALAAARARGSRAQLHMLATDRSMEPEVHDLVESLGMGAYVHVHPQVPHAEIAGWYDRADVYLSTSHHEGSNYSLIEALGFGCHPVVTDIPSHAAIVKELAGRFAIGDATTAGALISTPPIRPAPDIILYSREALSWGTIAEELGAIYQQSRRS